MPKQPSESTSRRSVPYNLSLSTMPGQIFMPLIPQATADWQLPYDHVQHNMMPLQDVMNPPPPTPHHHPPQQQQHSPYMPHHSQPQQQPQQSRQWHDQPPTPTLQQAHSGPWSTQDDEILVKARNMNLPWGTIHANHFPTKTANACRKRYERLVQKRRGTDWDEDRSARLAVAYKEMREQTWSPLADQLGERWDHVEKAVSCPCQVSIVLELM
jgi:Myb-like DNA-binding domain